MPVGFLQQPGANTNAAFIEVALRDGAAVLDIGRKYRVFSDKADGKYAASVAISYMNDQGNTSSLCTITADADEYRGYFDIEVLEVANALGNSKVAYEINGERTVGPFAHMNGMVSVTVELQNATRVLLFNEDPAGVGVVGAPGLSSFIRYSAYSDGTDFTDVHSASMKYIGFATGFEAPTDKSAYQWVYVGGTSTPSPGTGDGVGIPAGGATGQVLRKMSDEDYDVEWSDVTIPEQYGLVTYDQDKTITIT